jgi:trimeric autotransporter adhesin
MAMVLDGTGGITTNSGTLLSTSDATINGQTVGKGGGNVATNTAHGVSALNANTTAANNTAIGYQAGYTNTTSSQNTYVGSGAGYLTTGQNNVGVGLRIMFAGAGGSGGQNTAIGNYALYVNDAGASNTALGMQTLFSNTTGPSNTAVGYQALYGNTTGGYNVCVGQSSGSNASYSASYNSFIGYNSGRNTTTGSANLAIGIDSGTDAVFNITTQSYRAVIGDNSITNAYVKVAWTVTSDARDKTNIVPIGHGLNFVQQLNPVSYNFKKSREDDTAHGSKRYGFLAQEILALEGQDNVIIDNEDEQNLKYQGEALVPVLVKAIQELKTIVDAQAAEIAELKAKVM